MFDDRVYPVIRPHVLGSGFLCEFHGLQHSEGSTFWSQQLPFFSRHTSELNKPAHKYKVGIVCESEIKKRWRAFDVWEISRARTVAFSQSWQNMRWSMSKNGNVPKCFAFLGPTMRSSDRRRNNKQCPLSYLLDNLFLTLQASAKKIWFCIQHYRGLQESTCYKWRDNVCLV